MPEIALLDVPESSVAIDVTSLAPTAAGDGFAGSVSSSAQILKISSNSEAGSATGRKLTASVAAALPTNWKLTITPSTTIGSVSSTLSLDDTTTSADLITNILNKRQDNATLTYSFGPKANGDMMAFSAADGTAKTIDITYTLSDV